MRKYLHYFTKILVICFIIICLYSYSNKSYAVTTKENIEKLKQFIERYEQEELEKSERDSKKHGWKKMNAIRINFAITPKYIDPETNEEVIPYIGSFSAILADSEDKFKMQDIAVETFKEYFNKYISEELPDEERILDYFISGYFSYTRDYEYNDGDDIELKIRAFVIPASDNTTWAKGKDKYIGRLYTDKECIIEGYYTEYYYLHLVYQDGKYVIAYMDTKPEGFDDFVERMKTHGIDLLNIDYAELINSKSETELISQAAQYHNYNSENISLVEEKIGKVIIVTCSILIFGIVFIYFRSIKGKKINKL